MQAPLQQSKPAAQVSPSATQRAVHTVRPDPSSVHVP
jgi:hypothetical protein